MAENEMSVQNTAPEMSEKELNQLLQVRRDKLSELQAAGNDPFTITKYD